jgi:SAM-dependent methyltransferase
MAQHSSGLYSFLEFSAVYTAMKTVLLRKGGTGRFVGEYIKPLAGERVLDIGCGPGLIRPFLGDIDYVGLEPEPRYIKTARSQFPERSQFICKPVEAMDGAISGPFDIALAIGVLHHLDDAGARILFGGAKKALKPGGRLITLDCVLTVPQHPIARLLINLDRGKCVRTTEGYAALARESFERIDLDVRTDLLRVPYSHCITVCHA